MDQERLVQIKTLRTTNDSWVKLVVLRGIERRVSSPCLSPWNAWGSGAVPASRMNDNQKIVRHVT